MVLKAFQMLNGFLLNNWSFRNSVSWSGEECRHLVFLLLRSVLWILDTKLLFFFGLHLFLFTLDILSITFDIIIGLFDRRIEFLFDLVQVVLRRSISSLFFQIRFHSRNFLQIRQNFIRSLLQIVHIGLCFVRARILVSFSFEFSLFLKRIGLFLNICW